jgi:hypothetical protein
MIRLLQIEAHGPAICSTRPEHDAAERSKAASRRWPPFSAPAIEVRPR